MTTQPAKPQRLYLMQVATLPPNNTPIVCYLVQTSDGRNILIDSGLPDNVQPPPGRPTPVMGTNVIDQLTSIGVQPSDISTLICTHFDLDHAGHIADFPNAELVVQRVHYETARDGYPRFAASRLYWDVPASRYRLVDGDTELLPGMSLIATPGHVPGHQSVLVRLPENGPVLLTIDAVTTEASFSAERQAGPMDDDAALLHNSTVKLLDLVTQEDIRLVIFGHDGEQWKTLKKLPEYYS